MTPDPQSTLQTAKKGPAVVSQTSLLERRCACGKHTLAGAECETCRVQRRKTNGVEADNQHIERHPNRIQPAMQDSDRIAIRRAPAGVTESPSSSHTMAIPTWGMLPKEVRKDFTNAGFDKAWYSARSTRPLFQLTLLNNYVKLKGMNLWKYVKPGSGTAAPKTRDWHHPSPLDKDWHKAKPGGLSLKVDVTRLKSDLGDRSNFTGPESSMAEWSAREKRSIGSLHIKHFDGWSTDWIHTHIDQYGLHLKSGWWWLMPLIPLFQMLLHAIDAARDGYRDVLEIRDDLLKQGWWAEALLGVGIKSPYRRQRWSAEALETTEPGNTPMIDGILGAGHRLDRRTLEIFERWMGRDLSQVRVHHDAGADRAARAINALAFTASDHIYFRAGRYQPGTGDGRKLLTHELHHVAQQGAIQARGPGGAAPIIDPDPQQERQAVEGARQLVDRLKDAEAQQSAQESMVPHESHDDLKSGGILEMGAIDDPEEREADAVANQIIDAHEQRNPEIGEKGSGELTLRRQPLDLEDEDRKPPTETEIEDLERKEVDAALSEKEMPEKEDEEDDDGEIVRGKRTGMVGGRLSVTTSRKIQNLRGNGAELEKDAREYFEPRFGRDLSQVRVHAGNGAAEAASAIDARAFTVGSDIVFGRGEYRPRTERGRALLAHELTHVFQQDRSTGGPLRRAPAKQPAPARAALQAALDGDDDAVRELTTSKYWRQVTLTAKQAATLLGNLLTGVALDEDEDAGLRVLNKTDTQKVLDPTLLELDRRGRFGELMDDYHGVQYIDLLEILSKLTEDVVVKARYLDEFIAMWWVREHEEEAIVVLLEHTPPDERTELLTKKDRQQELRDAIDTDSLSLRYEKVVGEANIEQAGDLEFRLLEIFGIKARASVKAGKRKPWEVKRLLTLAAKDLASELLEYRKRLEEAIEDPDVDAAGILAINKEFEARLNGLIEQKKAEFRMELKYNVEFNRSLMKGYGTIWSKTDLEKMDEILSKIPPEILHASPNFGRFLREKRHGEYGGQTTGTSTIRLAGKLYFGTTSHELGHTIETGNPGLLKKFNKLSGWEKFKQTKFKSYITDAAARTKLIKALDAFREKGLEGKQHRKEHGDYYYRNERYRSTKDWFTRHKKDARFVSDYAATQPDDDFAESFEFYMKNPDVLKEKAPEKFDFMQQEVLIKWWLKNEKERIRRQIDEEWKRAADPFKGASGMLRKLRKKYVLPLKARLAKDLSAIEKTKLAEAKAGKLEGHLPLKDFDKLKNIPDSYLNQIRDLSRLAGSIARAMHDFSLDAKIMRLLVKTPNKTTHLFISIDLKIALDYDLLALIDPLAKRVLAGDRVRMKSWPKLEALKKKYSVALSLADEYMAYYDRVLSLRADYRTFASKLQARYWPGSSAEKRFKSFVKAQTKKLKTERRKIRDKVIESMKAGKSFKSAVLPRPKRTLDKYKRRLRSRDRKLRGKR